MVRNLFERFVIPRLQATLGRPSGQATTEYMLILGVLVLSLVFAFWLIAPGLRLGFIELAQRIIAETP